MKSGAMDDRFTERLSEYLDGDLSGPERDAVEEHLSGCRACAETLEGLRLVRLRAGALRDAPPGADLWPGIADRIGGDRGGSRAIRPVRRVGTRPRAPWRVSVSVPRLIAAGLAVAVVSASAMWLVSRRATPPVDPIARDAVEDLNRLRRVLAEGRGRLDPRTVQTLEENLRIIEIAIAQSRRALQDDPGDAYVREHLSETMKRKVELMQRAAVLASAP